MKQPISVCMIVKNEADNLAKSIPAISPYVQEVIVVDTGSSDDSRDIATQLGARVLEFVWQDDFSAARNFSLAQASQPFVLVLDADEIFQPDSFSALHHYCTKQGQTAGNVQIINLSQDEETTVTIRLPRLFPNSPDYRYIRRIHEQLRYQGAYPQTVETNIRFLHTGYTKTAMEQVGKIERNLRLLELEIQQAPHDPYLLFQLGKTYYADKQYEQAARSFQAAVDELANMQGISPAFLPSLLVQFAYSLLHLKDYHALFQVLEAGVDLYPDFTHLYFLYGQALIEMKDPTRMAEIPSTFEYCLHLGDNEDKYETVRGVGSFMAQYNLGVYYEVTGDRERAIAYYGQADAAGYKPATRRLQTLHPQS